MNKKIKIFLIPTLAVSSLAAFTLSGSLKDVLAEEGKTYHVDFYSNYVRANFTLSNGTTGTGNNLLFKTIDVNENSLVSKPSEIPTRKRYEFIGWFKDQACQTAWNFESDKVTGNTRLYAGWDISHEPDIVEPSYTPPSTVLDEGASEDYVFTSLMNFKPDGSAIKVSGSALTKLVANKDNVLPLMEYKVKASKTMTATYDANTLTIRINGEVVKSYTITNNSANYTITADDSKDYYKDYEAKAAKYEAKALEEESYHVMLAGSSSIEFWDTSKQDLDPVVSYNHGIGGTTIEMWTNKLNQRLVYPYKPKMVVYYVGINNVINSKESTSAINNKLQTFFNSTHAALPDTQVQYILLNQLPSYSSYKDAINNINNFVRNYQSQNNNASWLTLINPGEALMKPTGVPDAAYFRTDGLHLSYYGYVIWGGIIRDSILDGLEKMAK